MISKSNFKLWSARQGACRYFIQDNEQIAIIRFGFCDIQGTQGRGKRLRATVRSIYSPLPRLSPSLLCFTGI